MPTNRMGNNQAVTVSMKPELVAEMHGRMGELGISTNSEYIRRLVLADLNRRGEGLYVPVVTNKKVKGGLGYKKRRTE